MKMKALKVSQYLQISELHRPKSHLFMKLPQIASPYFDAMICSKMWFSIRFIKMMSNFALC